MSKESKERIEAQSAAEEETSAPALAERVAEALAGQAGSGLPAARIAAMNWDVEAARALLAQGHSLDASAEDGSGGRKDPPLPIVLSLLEPQPKDGAAIQAMADFLAESHVNLNAADGKGKTALHHALENGAWRWAQALMRNGADIYLKSAEGNTAIDDAKIKMVFADNYGFAPWGKEALADEGFKGGSWEYFAALEALPAQVEQELLASQLRQASKSAETGEGAAEPAAPRRATRM